MEISAEKEGGGERDVLEKEKDQKKEHDFEIASEGLAVPEIHIGRKKAAHKEEHPEELHHESILYDDVAIPEVHIPVKRKK